jgi:type I restriction-modification system DNA methylase subunit
VGMGETSDVKKLVDKLWEVLDHLRGTPLVRDDAFKITFALFAYKRFSDANIINMPETCKWDQLVNHPVDQFFAQLEDNFNELQTANELPNISSVLNLKQFNDQVPSDIKERLIVVFKNMDLSPARYSTAQVNEIVSDFFQRYFSRHDNFESKSLNRLALALLAPDADETLYFPQCGQGDIIIQAFDYFEDNKYRSFYDPEDEDEILPFNASGTVSNADLWSVVVLRVLLAEIPWVDIKNEGYFPDTAYASGQEESISAKASRPAYERKVISQFKEIDPGFARVVEEVKKIQDRLFEKYSLGDLLEELPYMAHVIFFISPFGFHLPSNIQPTINVKDRSFEIPRNQSELFLLLQSLKHLYKRGRIGIVLPSDVLFKEIGIYKKVREFLIEEDLLEAVVQLPSRIFSQVSLNLVLMIINAEKQKEKKTKFAFITVRATKKNNVNVITDDSINKAIYVYKNFTSLSNDYIASLEEIQRQEYSLLPSRYMGSIAEEIRKIRSSRTGRPLGDIGRVIRGTSTGVSDKMRGIPIITTKNLAEDVKDLYLDLDDVSYADPQLSAQSINQKCIVVSLIGNELRPTIFDPEILKQTIRGPEILLGKNVAAIFPDESEVDFDYLYYQLNSSLVKTQFEESLARAGIPNISLSRLKQIIIPVLEKRVFA